tara:strand:+ start:3547 stop:4455 length:909 start_codon:yes stop_codon:yes gene_type:complete
MIEQRLHIVVICEGQNFFNWITSTIQVSNIMVETINQTTIDSLSTISASPNSDLLLIIEYEIYLKNFKKISNKFSAIGFEFPILVVTDTYTDTTNRSDTFTIIDTIVKPILSIHSLEYAIRSLLKDHKITQKLKQLAHFDALTGAANRYLFDDRMTEILKNSKRNKEPFSLLYFDLNGFKMVNDSHGHAIGDLFLKHFVTRLNQVKRETDTLARLGGDEFCMLLPNTNDQNLSLFVDRIIDSFSTPFLDFDVKLPIKSAIGGVTVKDQSISMLTPQEIIKVADKCVYEAKRSTETHSVLKVI